MQIKIWSEEINIGNNMVFDRKRVRGTHHTHCNLAVQFLLSTGSSRVGDKKLTVIMANLKCETEGIII